MTEKNMVSQEIKNSKDKFTNLSIILSGESDVPVKAVKYDKDRNFKLKKQFTGRLLSYFIM